MKKSSSSALKFKANKENRSSSSNLSLSAKRENLKTYEKE